jgi:integrase
MSGPKHPNNNNGLLRIRFKYNGINFTLTNLGKVHDTIAYNHAQNICDRIRRDIDFDAFTPTNNAELTLKYNPSAIHTTLNKHIIKNLSFEKEESVVTNINVKKKCIDALKDTQKVVEKNTLVKLQNYTKSLQTKQDVEVFVDWLKKECKLSSSSVSRYFDVLRTFDDVFKTVKITVENKPKPKPFSKEEVQNILTWFEKHKVEYYNYVYFLFSTGCRTSEAIGLRWKHIDLDARNIYFYETLARDNNNSAKRVHKTTKKNVLRTFPINNTLYEFLTCLPKEDNDDLLFLINGHCIDDKNFCNRYWKTCLKECEIPYRKPYNTRHTFISHFLEQTKDVVKCASLTHGTKTGIKTIWEHYASIINKVEVPDLY